MYAGFTMSAVMAGLNLHTNNRLGPVSDAINSITGESAINRFLKNPLNTTYLSGWLMMGLGLTGLGVSFTDLSSAFFDSTTTHLEQAFVSAATGLIGFSLKRKGDELSATLEEQAPIKLKGTFNRAARNFVNSETPLTLVAGISHYLALGENAAFTLPIVALSLFASLASSKDVNKPAISSLKSAKISDSTFSRGALSLGGGLAGLFSLASGNVWLGISNLLASKGNYHFFRTMAKNDAQNLRR